MHDKEKHCHRSKSGNFLHADFFFFLPMRSLIHILLRVLKYCKMPSGGGGEERNEKDFRKQCSERYLIHQIILNGSLVL